jgi:hypothetical protein
MRLIPDYTRSKVEVYTSVVETVIRAKGSLAILSYNGHGWQLPEDGPTWVPRWDEPFGAIQLSHASEHDAHGFCGGIPLGPCGEGWKMVEGILSIRAITVATVLAVGDPLEPRSIPPRRKESRECGLTPRRPLYNRNVERGSGYFHKD